VPFAIIWLVQTVASPPPKLQFLHQRRGGVAERLKAAVLKNEIAVLLSDRKSN
jgi:hypothetical protein